MSCIHLRIGSQVPARLSLTKKLRISLGGSCIVRVTFQVVVIVRTALSEGRPCGIKSHGGRLLGPQEAGIVFLSQVLIATILAYSFLCLFPEVDRHLKHLQGINFDELFYVPVYASVHEAREQNKVHTSGVMEDQPGEALKVVFADEYFGVLTLRDGCLQQWRLLVLKQVSLSGYGVSDSRSFSSSGVSRRILAVLPCSSCPVHKLRIIENGRHLKSVPDNISFVCRASSSGHRRNNPDFSRNKKHGFRGRNRRNEDRDGLDGNGLEDSEMLSSKNGHVFSLSNSPKFQATSSPGPREKEIVDLFRKVQAQLRARAAHIFSKETLIGATNRPDRMDPAVQRAGRFGRHFYVPLPDESQRYEILKSIVKALSVPVDPSVDLNDIATMESCKNRSGADLYSLVKEAGFAAYRDTNPTSERTIKMVHFEKAFTNLKPPLTNKQMREYKKIYAEFHGDN